MKKPRFDAHEVAKVLASTTTSKEVLEYMVELLKHAINSIDASVQILSDEGLKDYHPSSIERVSAHSIDLVEVLKALKLALQIIEDQ